MSKHGMLDTVFNDILKAVTPLREDWDIRFAIINDLRSVVESVESLRGAAVEPFGSFVSNLFARRGDLDISIELSNGLHISSAGKKQKQTLLADLLKALRMKGVGSNILFISNARVPILKFKSIRQGLSCDISINNLPGQMKSKILLWMSRIDGRFRDMVLLVKEWAKTHKINNSKTGTFNSYTLSLLVIFHFQSSNISIGIEDGNLYLSLQIQKTEDWKKTCCPAILPPLKDIYPGNMADDLRGVRADAENLIAETCDANINRFISDKSRPINRKSLPEHFVEFLRKFAQMNSWASELGICPYTGQWEQIKNNMIWLPKTYAIFVEDPFEQPQNSARSVGAGQMKKIAEAFLRTYSLLISKNSNQSSLLAILATPQVARFIPKAPIQNYSGGGGGYFPTTQPQVQKAIHQRPSPQLQRRIQNASEGTSSTSSSSRGNTQVNRSQRVTWKPKLPRNSPLL